MKLFRQCTALLMLLLMIVTLGASGLSAMAEAPFEYEEGNRWGSSADRIDQYLDTAFEQYLAGDNKAAYDSVNNAYFKVYETTGFERQTMSYVSGPRKNAVELEYTTCKAAVKKTETDDDTKSQVRTELNKLKTMIREDANKLATKDGEPLTEMTWWLNGEQVDYDPWADIAGDPNAAVHYKSWTEAAEAIGELLDTAQTAYKGKDFEAAQDNLNTAYYTVYEESGLSHTIYQKLTIPDRKAVDATFLAAMDIAEGEKYQPTAFKSQLKKVRKSVSGVAADIDEIEAAEKAEEAAAAAEAAAAEQPAAQSDPRLLTFLGAFGIIVREGLEAILVIAAIIAYLTKSGNARSLKNVYLGAVMGILASFVAAAILYFVKQAVAGAGMAQEIIEGVTALIAVCVLFYVSNWMISKAEAAAWSGYIDSKVQSSVERRSAFTLAFTAFLSVFREGAEVVLFYQPMLSEGNAGMVWAGFGAGCILLVFIYLAITKLSIKLPIKVFFTVTSILMAVMCVAFLGSGIKELAEGGLFDCTLYVTGVPENDAVQVLGIYPYLETLLPQLILSIILLVTFMMAHYRGKIQALKKETAKA